MKNQIPFTPDYAISFGPNGNAYVQDRKDDDRMISINAFLHMNWNPWSEAEKSALRTALRNNSIAA